MIAVALLVLLGCSEPDPCDGLRDVPLSPASLQLTRGEHRVGWGLDQCFGCHQVWAIHAHDCTQLDNIDVTAIVDEIDPEDAQTCVPCHGDNGAPSLEEEPT